MRVFITGTAGFIGYHLARHLLAQGAEVHGFDGMTDYYDPALKRARHDLLAQAGGARFSATEALLEDMDALQAAYRAAIPDVVVHLAAQAGVRYSLENPRAYLDTNIVGTFNVMECARMMPPRHLLMASTSSVFGANPQMPYAEADKADWPLSFYAATKKATEAMSHSYAHLHGLPTTMFRFFTVYGPWGRPDMALYGFTRAVLAGDPIRLHNHGRMWRDFTYVDDLVRGIALLIDAVPGQGTAIEGDTLSPAAPWRVVNIGNSNKVALADFVAAIEAATGKTAVCEMVDAVPGEVEATWADCALLQRLTGYQPETPLSEGVAQFVTWYRDWHRV
jgi:UDP-glucuronate 4-epimerase